MTAPRNPFPDDYDVGDYVGDNFEELKRYLQILGQNGRSIYNVDENEKQSINDNWKRRLMQNLVDKACVEDAFQIVGTGADNDFQIIGGDNANDTPKNAFVGGFMPIADANSTYLLHNTQYNEDFGETPPALTTPISNRTDSVYLDVYLKEITYLDDEFLVPDNLKVGLTTRLRLIQEVKVAEGGSIPSSPFTTAGGTTHYLLPLATIERFTGQDAINAFDVTDDRRTISYGTLANGGLALTDPGGMQSAIDNTSGGLPSISRHVLLGTDARQDQLDNAAPGNQTLVGSSGMQDALDNVAGIPTSINPVILLSDIPVPTAAATSFDNSGTGLSATDVQGMGEELDARGLGNVEWGIVIEVSNTNFVTIFAGANVLSTDKTVSINNTANVTLSTLVSGAGGIDTGSEAPSVWYAIFLIFDSTLTNPIDGILVTEANASSPTIPAGYDKAGFVGWARNSSGSNFLPGQQINDWFKYYDEQELVAGFASTPFTNINTSNFSSPTTRMIDVRIDLFETGQNLNRTLHYSNEGNTASTGGVLAFRMRTGQEIFDAGANVNTVPGLPIGGSVNRAFSARGNADSIAITGFHLRLAV